MRSRSDVVVIGGGIIGSSIAHILANENLSVTVLERDSIGSHASGFALGLLNPTNDTGITEPLVHQAFKLHQDQLEQVQEESGVDAQVQILPHLELALEESEITALESEVDRINNLPNFKASWLEPEEIQKLESRLTEQLSGGVLVEDVIMLDSYNLTLATAQAAEVRGAKFVLKEATGIVYESNRAVAVMMGEDRVDCDVVVLALGPWSGASGLWIDIDVPIVPQKGEIIRVEALDPPLGMHVHGNPLGHSCSVVQKSDGATWLAATVKDDTGFDVTPSAEALEALSLRGVRMMPELESSQLVLHTACMRPVTPDGGPILGKVPGKEGTFIATGTGGKGILLAPLVARSVADLITHGKSEIDISDFGLDRFSAS